MASLDRVLRKLLNVFSDVKSGEAIPAVVFLINLFVVLTAYYIIKTAREPLILATGGAEMKSYAAGAQAIVLIGFVPFYGWLASRVSRLRMIIGLTVFFVVCIQIFYGLAYWNEKSDVSVLEYLGFAFYVWVGIFSLSMIAQFWSFANDVWSEKAGERLFPIIGIGATVGAPAGSAIAAVLFDAGVGAYEMLQISAGLLVVHVGLYVWLDRHLEKSGESDSEPLEKSGGFALVLENSYLRKIALLLIVLNLVNTTGEYVLSAAVVEAAEAQGELSKDAFIGRFYGEFFSVVNVIAVVLQALVVSRLVKHTGMVGVLLALPIVAFGAYALIAAGFGLVALRWAKTAENSTDYSVMNTAKAMLWLPTSREEKYKAKQAIDTFFVRLGDVLSALVVFVGTTYLSFEIRGFAIFNLVIILGWIALAISLARHYRRLAHEDGAQPS